jgi:hypothetical protein
LVLISTHTLRSQFQFFRRDYHFIVRAARQLEDRNSYELIEDLGVNSDSMPSNNGLKHQPAFIILDHLKVGIEQPDQPSVHNAGTRMEIPPMISLDNVMDTVQMSHHDIGPNNVSLSNYWFIHNFGSKGCSISLYPLANPELWTTGRHNSAKETNKICQK